MLTTDSWDAIFFYCSRRRPCVRQVISEPVSTARRLRLSPAASSRWQSALVWDGPAAFHCAEGCPAGRMTILLQWRSSLETPSASMSVGSGTAQESSAKPSGKARVHFTSRRPGGAETRQGGRRSKIAARASPLKRRRQQAAHLPCTREVNTRRPLRLCIVLVKAAAARLLWRALRSAGRRSV